MVDATPVVSTCEVVVCSAGTMMAAYGAEVRFLMFVTYTCLPAFILIKCKNSTLQQHSWAPALRVMRKVKQHRHTRFRHT